jgi:hypothetical protein
MDDDSVLSDDVDSEDIDSGSEPASIGGEAAEFDLSELFRNTVGRLKPTKNIILPGLTILLGLVGTYLDHKGASLKGASQGSSYAWKSFSTTLLASLVQQILKIQRPRPDPPIQIVKPPNSIPAPSTPTTMGPTISILLFPNALLMDAMSVAGETETPVTNYSTYTGAKAIRESTTGLALVFLDLDNDGGPNLLEIISKRLQFAICIGISEKHHKLHKNIIDPGSVDAVIKLYITMTKSLGSAQQRVTVDRHVSGPTARINHGAKR